MFWSLIWPESAFEETRSIAVTSDVVDICVCSDDVTGTRHLLDRLARGSLRKIAQIEFHKFFFMRSVVNNVRAKLESVLLEMRGLQVRKPCWRLSEATADCLMMSVNSRSMTRIDSLT